jgi:uncharacterized membrane protein
MINTANLNTKNGVSVAGAVATALTLHAAHAAKAAAVKHRVAAGTDESVDWGDT